MYTHTDRMNELNKRLMVLVVTLEASILIDGWAWEWREAAWRYNEINTISRQRQAECYSVGLLLVRVHVLGFVFLTNGKDEKGETRYSVE